MVREQILKNKSGLLVVALCLLSVAGLVLLTAGNETLHVVGLYGALAALVIFCAWILARRIRGVGQLARRHTQGLTGRLVLLRSVLESGLADVKRSLRDSEAARGRAATSSNAKLNALAVQNGRLHEGLEAIAKGVSNSEAARARAALADNAKLNSILEGVKRGQETSQDVSIQLAELWEGMKQQQVLLERVAERMTALEVRIDVLHAEVKPVDDKHKARVLEALGLGEI